MNCKNLHKQYMIGFLFAILIIFTGCLERLETIQIDKQGNTIIIAEFDGKAEGFENSASYPTEQLWNIIEKNQYNSKDDDQKIKLKAEQKIKYGNQFYNSYVRDANSDKTLQFPTEVKMWKDGNKTYYKFTRIYKARTFARLNGPEELDQFKKLEEKVTKDGIFNVSEQERNEYVNKLSEFIKYHNFYIYLDAIGVMIQNNNLAVSLKQTAANDIKNYFEEKITDQKILDILRLEDSLLDKEYENLLQLIETEVTDILSKATTVDQSKQDSPFNKALRDVRFEYQVTKALTSDNFCIAIQMPGEIVSTNGFTEYDSPGQVYWEFKGKALHDRDVPLYALSVVEQ